MLLLASLSSENNASKHAGPNMDPSGTPCVDLHIPDISEPIRICDLSGKNVPNG